MEMTKVKLDQPLASDFAVLFHRIMGINDEVDRMRQSYRRLYERMESGEIDAEHQTHEDLLKTFNVAGFVHLAIVAARAAQTAAIVANDVSLSRVFDPALKDAERALRHIESRAS